MSIFNNDNSRPDGLIQPVTRFDPSAGFSEYFSREDHRHQLDPGILSGLFGVSNINLLDNCGFTVQQRTLPVASAPSVTYAVDRWSIQTSGAARYSVNVSTDLPVGVNAYRSLLHTVTTVDSSLAAGDYSFINQGSEKIFGDEFVRHGTSSSKSSTVTFWAKSSVAGIYCFSLRSSSSNSSFVSEFTLVANEWKKIIVSIPPITTGTWGTNFSDLFSTFSITLATGTTFQTATTNSWVTGNFLGTANQVNFSATNGATFHLAAPTWVAGTSSIDYVPQGFDKDLQKCSRYFQVFVDPPLRGVIESGTYAGRCGMVLPVTMRAAPTVTTSGSSFIWDGSFSSVILTIPNTRNTTKYVEHDFTMNSGFTVGRAAILYNNGPTGSWFYSSEI